MEQLKRQGEISFSYRYERYAVQNHHCNYIGQTACATDLAVTVHVLLFFSRIQMPSSFFVYLY